MIKHKLAYIISTAAVLGSAGIFPAFAAENVVTGNGAFSDNHVFDSQRNETSVRQSNNTNISNNVRNNLNTGRNSANFNTGGDVVIRTGDANANTHIQNTAGFNAAYVSSNGCSSCGSNNNVRIEGNGAFSNNAVRVSDNNSHTYKQDNNTRFNNDVRDNNNTGYNNPKYDNHESYTQPYVVKDDHKQYDNNNYDHNKKDYNNKDYSVSYKQNSGYERNSYSSSNMSNYKSNSMKHYNSYSKNNNCNCDYFNQKYDNYKPFYGGNTHGDVTISTGNANSYNWLANMAGHNSLY